MSTVKATNITHGSNSGTANMVLASDGSITFAKTMFASYAIICDRKDSTTDGGSFSTDAWRTRDLNHEIADPDSIVSISSNQFTLQAGTYLLKWRAPAYEIDRHVTRLYDITNSALKEYGNSGYSSSSSGATVTFSEGFARVTISGATAYEIQHACQTTNSSNYAFGLASETNAAGDHASGTTEGYSIYTIVEIYKEA